LQILFKILSSIEINIDRITKFWLYKLRKIARKILGRDKIKSIGKEYWENAAKGNVKKTMNKICDGFDPEDFATKTDSITLVKEFQIGKDSEVLDLACGMGRTCRWIAPRVKSYIGVDFIEEMIEKAKSYNSEYHNAQFFVNDGKTLSIFPNEKFDVAYCELAFQHMPKEIQQSYVNELFRVLKKNGKFFANIPRIEFYKDPVFASSREEVDRMFSKFDCTHLQESDAYYFIMAKKSE
jgi:ubiquinone/menaquinone biosynthesis C-methylase UbiE